MSREAPAGGVAPAKRSGRGRGRPTDVTGEDTRAAILKAALRRFGEAGYRGVSMDVVAHDCGVNARSIYYHFSSKRQLFEAATDEAFTRFGNEILARVFSQASVRARVQGYVDVYRTLHHSAPHVIAFTGRAVLDALSGDGRDAERSPSDAGGALRTFLEVLVDDALARGEVDGDLDRDGLVLLLTSIGMGLSLAALDDRGAFLPMLDALERLNDGTLFTEPRE